MTVISILYTTLAMLLITMQTGQCTDQIVYLMQLDQGLNRIANAAPKRPSTSASKATKKLTEEQKLFLTNGTNKILSSQSEFDKANFSQEVLILMEKTKKGLSVSVFGRPTDEIRQNTGKNPIPTDRDYQKLGYNADDAKLLENGLVTLYFEHNKFYKETSSPTVENPKPTATKELTEQQREFLRHHAALPDWSLPNNSDEYTQQNFSDEIWSVVTDSKLLNTPVSEKINRFTKLGYDINDATLIADLLRNAYHAPQLSKATQTSNPGAPTVENPKLTATKKLTDIQKVFLEKVNRETLPSESTFKKAKFDDNLIDFIEHIYTTNYAMTDQLTKYGYSFGDASLLLKLINIYKKHKTPYTGAKTPYVKKELTESQRNFLNTYKNKNVMQLFDKQEFISQQFNPNLLYRIEMKNGWDDEEDFIAIGYSTDDARLLSSLTFTYFTLKRFYDDTQPAQKQKSAIKTASSIASSSLLAAPSKPAFTEAQREFINAMDGFSLPTLQNFIEQGFDKALPKDIKRLNEIARGKKLDNIVSINDTPLTAADTFVSEELAKQGYSTKDADLIAEWRMVLQHIS